VRPSAVLPLAVGLLLAACVDGEEPSTDGTLVVSTSTGGGDPDQDGYWLTVDGRDSLLLAPTGTAELRLPSGGHSLRLHGMAQHCSVVEGASREVDVPSRGAVSVAFEVSCPASAVRITTTTTGLDIDPDGYHVLVDGTDRGSIPSNGTLLTRVDPGSRMIALTGLAPLCTPEGSGSRAVTVPDLEVVPVEFAIVCTATTGAIGVVVEASGPYVNSSFVVVIDGVAAHYVEGGVLIAHYVAAGGRTYVSGVPGGDHVVSLSGPRHCSVETEPRPVTITTGELIRDTVEVSFSVICAQEPSGNVRVTAPTTGIPPSSTPYRVWYEHYGAWGYGGEAEYLGDLEPNGALVADLAVSSESGADPYWYNFHLVGVPTSCGIDDPHPNALPGFTITHGDTLEVKFTVTCAP
jgi:hypothetical protein